MEVYQRVIWFKVCLGAMVALGWQGQRAGAAGELDSRFGSGGIAIVDVAEAAGISFSSEWTSKLLVQPDGKILLAGTTSLGREQHFVVARVLPNGDLDPSFSGDGIGFYQGEGLTSFCRDAALQADGKIILSGDVTSPDRERDFALLRLDPNGEPDETFSGDGWAVNSFSASHDFGVSVKVQPDGKLVVAGKSGDEMCLVRCLSDGSLDPAFGTGGITTTQISEVYRDTAEDVFVLGDGKLLLAGSAGGRDFLLIRYNADGALDTTFSENGYVVTDLGTDSDCCAGAAIQPDGKIVAAGISDGWLGCVRHLPDGSLDTSFSEDGIARIPVEYLPVREGTVSLVGGLVFAEDVAVQPDGRIVVIGCSDAGKEDEEPIVVRLTADGEADADFSVDGIVLPFHGNEKLRDGSNEGRSLGFDAEGRILAAGGWAGDLFVVRLESAPKPDAAVVGWLDGGLGGRRESGLDVVDFGAVEVSAGLVIREFELQNVGALNLEDIELVIAGADGQYLIDLDSPAENVLPPGGTLPFEISYDPSELGIHEGVLIIASNDPDESAFEIPLIGRGVDAALSYQEEWRLIHYGTSENVGAAADLADGDGDGFINLLEWALGLDPEHPDTWAFEPQLHDGYAAVRYQRSRYAEEEGVQYSVEWSDSLADLEAWSSTGVTNWGSIDIGNGNEAAQARIPVEGGRRFLRLVVTLP